MSSTTMPRSSTPSTLPGPAQRVERIGGEQLAGVIYAAVWLVFLAVPVLGVFASDAGLVGQVYVCAAVVVFAGIYCWLAWSWFTCAEEDRPGWAALASAVGSLGLIGLSTVPFISAWAVAFAPYLTALVVFVRRPSQGIPLGILIWALPAAVGALFTDLESSWVVLGPGIGTVFIIAIRITEFYEDRGRRYAEQLRAAEERSSIARDVHDVLGHSLTVLHVKAQVARRMMHADPERARAELDQIESLSREALSEVRTTVTRLRAPELPGELEVSRTTLQSAGIAARISDQLGEGNTAPAALAWALREGITNVVRHSEASRCDIEISPQHLRIADDGAGLGSSAEGNGLRGLRERAAAEGADVVVGRAYPELEGTQPERPGTVLEVSLR